MAKRKAAREQQPQQYPWEQIEGATGASDADSGAGSGAGIPSGDLAMRVGDEVTRGNVEQDKRKLFPERFAKRPGTSAAKKKSGTAKRPTAKRATPRTKSKRPKK